MRIKMTFSVSAVLVFSYTIRIFMFWISFILDFQFSYNSNVSLVILLCAFVTFISFLYFYLSLISFNFQF